MCLIYTCLQRMGVPTERGTVEVYTCLELHFFLFSCQFSLPLIVNSKMIMRLFLFFNFFFAFFHTMHRNRFFFKTKSYFHLYIFHLYLKSHVCFVLTFFKRVYVQEFYWSSSQMQHKAELTVQSG